jgi:hypothetical protein
MRLSKRAEKSCLYEVGRVETFGEPVVNRLKLCHGIGRTAVIRQQPGKEKGTLNLILLAASLVVLVVLRWLTLKSGYAL